MAGREKGYIRSRYQRHPESVQSGSTELLGQTVGNHIDWHRGMFVLTIDRMALTEARLVVSKLLWHFELQLDGPHESWVEDARFYVSDVRRKWQLALTLKPDPLAASTLAGSIDTCSPVADMVSISITYRLVCFLELCYPQFDSP